MSIHPEIGKFGPKSCISIYCAFRLDILLQLGANGLMAFLAFFHREDNCMFAHNHVHFGLLLHTNGFT
jgi:hypothetical protein